MARPGSTTLLVGETGCGKAYLAQSAAQTLTTDASAPVYEVIAENFDDLLAAGHLSQPLATPQHTAEHLLDALLTHAAGRSVIVFALHIDRYEYAATAVLELLVRNRQLRFVCTATQIVGAADRLIRDPSVHQIAVAPLTAEECGALLARLFEVDHVADHTRNDWHASTRGNPHALATLALAAIRRGVVRRARRMAWVSRADYHPPIDFVTQLGELSDIEGRTLEVVAFATPMHEPALYHLLDSAAVNSLMARQILTVRTTSEGMSFLTTQLPVLTEAVLAHLSPVRRTELANLCFDALLTEDDTLTSANRLRLVKFGVQAGRELPVDWLWQGMRAMRQSGDLRFVLQITLAAMRHENSEHAAEAMMRAADLASFVNDQPALDEALAAISEVTSNETRLDALPFGTQYALVSHALCLNPALRVQPDFTLTEFDLWHDYWQAKGISAPQHMISCRMRTLALHGRVHEAHKTGKELALARTLDTERLSAIGRAYQAVLHVQRGEFQLAITQAEQARKLMLLHDISPTLSGDLEGLTVFLAHWARGTTLSAREAAQALTATERPDLAAVHAQSGFADLAISLFSAQEGRWYDTLDTAERLLEALKLNDPFGVAPFAHAISALANAALGFDERAREELRLSEQTVPGVSLMLNGLVSIAQLRTKHWLRDPDLTAHAVSLAAWAKDEHLALIELKAIDVIAYQTSQLSPEQFTRAQHLAKRVDPPIGSAILAHIHALTNNPI
ncbi:MAG: hypothetical protein GX862_11075, partial [Leucobacter sp.]|nr:hypothetical protein [Leucobacter sp.]